MELVVLDNVVSAANLSCTVANEGSFQWQWTPPPGINISQMWVADGTRTSCSIVQISQISAANAEIWDICTILVLVPHLGEGDPRWRGPLPLEGTLIGYSTGEVGS